MIKNPREMQIALRNLRIFGETSAALQEELADANPDLRAAALPAYVNRIASLQTEIAEYLYAHPADISQIAAALPADALTK
jgi:hypothetical protein